jgi:guanine deaminase
MESKMQETPPTPIAYRASIFHFTDDPRENDASDCYEFFEDGLLVLDRGRVLKTGSYDTLIDDLPPDCRVHDRSGTLIMPGFIDTHVHYPQIDIIASHGKQLMDWLTTYTYPCEQRFEDPRVARTTARVFIDELIRNGTTTAMVLPTVYPHSVDALFEAADACQMRLVAGKVLMDRNVPEGLRDTALTAYDDSNTLITRWHGRNRLSYAVTPRFALTSSEAQLEVTGALIREHPDVLLHTHLAETLREVSLIQKAFPWSRSYLDVYDRFGLVCDRSVFAHGIHLSDDDFRQLSERGAAIAHCPTSNLFLGSGLFDLKTARSHQIGIGLGTDVGAGTSLSLFKTMAEAYKVCQLRGAALSPFHSFYLAGLGGARILGLDHAIGNFLPGKEADFIVIDPRRLPLLDRRVARAERLEEVLFALMILGDDRIIAETHVNGVRVETPAIESSEQTTVHADH